MNDPREGPSLSVLIGTLMVLCAVVIICVTPHAAKTSSGTPYIRGAMVLTDTPEGGLTLRTGDFVRFATRDNITRRLQPGFYRIESIQDGVNGLEISFREQAVSASTSTINTFNAHDFKLELQHLKILALTTGTDQNFELVRKSFEDSSTSATSGNK